MTNSNITFNLSRGNASNDMLGIGIDYNVFGKSLGGMFFDEEILLNKEIYKHKLLDGNQEIFDPIVPTDVIKSQINYSAIFITNRSFETAISLDNISISDVIPDSLTSFIPGVTGAFPISDIDIAIEGMYTLNEVKRNIPNDFGKPANPSIVLDDEFDSTQKLNQLIFKKLLSGTDLPSEIPPNCVLKLWLKREIVITKMDMPEDELEESVNLSVTESNLNITNLNFSYAKLKGRIPLSNWYDYTITNGATTSIQLKELLPKEVPVQNYNIINTFVVNKKIVLFYYVDIGTTKNYFLLSIKTHDDVNYNKYVQVQLFPNPSIPDNVNLYSRTLIDIRKSFYNFNEFYLFWHENLTKKEICNLQFFGYYEKYTRSSVDPLDITVWTSDEIFNYTNYGFDNRKIETYTLNDFKVIRDNILINNLEQFDDLFILFTQNTKNLGLISSIENINLNKNELLYVFEKDIKNSKNNNYNSYPGINSQVFSQRLYPTSLPTIDQITLLNYTKNKDCNIIINNSSTISTAIKEPRKIKYLVDGTRYVDLNSFTMTSIDVNKNFITYDFPANKEIQSGYSLTAGICIKNDENIYESLTDIYLTNYLLTNIKNDVMYQKPLFQQNIVDVSNINSLSIPVEWVNRTYKNEWKTILNTLTIISRNNNNPVYTLQYNFACNVWRSIVVDVNGDVQYIYHDDYINTTNTISTTGAGTSGVPIYCKSLSELDIEELNWVIEPDVFQPLTIKVEHKQVYSNQFQLNKYFVNIQVYFKGNSPPLVDVSTYTNNLSNVSYIAFNHDSQFNMKLNYLDLFENNIDDGFLFRITNLHLSILHKLTVDIGKELTVDPQLFQKQALFKYYRIIKLSNLNIINNLNNDMTIPIILYGNGYKQINDNYNSFLSIENPFDFSKIRINDTSIRIYTDNNSTIPVKFKISKYEYDNDYCVLWVRLQDISKNNYKIYLFYDKSSTDYKDEIYEQYSYLKNNIYSPSALGGWHMDELIKDSRLSYSTGRIFNAGEPIIYEKSVNNELRLTKVDKEYMFGIAKIYKSHKFNLTIEDKNIDDEMLDDEETKKEFETFIRDSVTIFKPSYTELVNIKSSDIAVLEAGENSMGLSNNRRVTGLIAMTPNTNVNTYYNREDLSQFTMLTSFNGFSQNIDWVVAKTIDSSVIKTGVIKINGKVKSETIRFETPFKDSDYFVFFSNPKNQKIYWNSLCPDRFTISASYYLEKEISWMAFHRDCFGGIYTPDSIFVGKRTLSGKVFIDSDDNEYTEWPGNELTDISFPSPTEDNLTYWYNNELIIKPDYGVEGDPGIMNIDINAPGYALILSSNQNINIYWTNKMNNKFNIKTSSPSDCIVHYLCIKNGVEWWKEII